MVNKVRVYFHYYPDTVFIWVLCVRSSFYPDERSFVIKQNESTLLVAFQYQTNWYVISVSERTI